MLSTNPWDEPMVSLDEIASVLKRKPRDVERDVRALNLFVYKDWAGRPALILDDARGFASGQYKADREAKRRWDEHQERCEVWLAGRRQASLDAASAVRSKADRMASTPETEGKASAAANVAVREYERTVERPKWINGEFTIPLSFIDENEPAELAEAKGVPA
jgi:hypothetical protein